MRTVLNFCHDLPEKIFGTGETLLEEGGTDKCLYILIEGELEVMKGETHLNSQSEPGAIFGELAVLLDIPHTATVKATLPTRTYVVEDAGKFLKSYPDLTYLLAVMLAKKLNSISSYLVDLKKQFEDKQDHLGMVDEVLETLLNEPVEDYTVGSDRYPDTTI